MTGKQDFYDELTAFEEEANELSNFLEGLSDEQWRHPSACEGWSISDVVLHLAQSEEGVIATFDHGNAGMSLAPYVGDALENPESDGAVDAVVEAAVRAERPDDPADALPRWQTAHEAVMKRFRDTEPSMRLNWISAPLSARTLATTRLAEHWIHGLDIREPLGSPAPDTDRLRHIARLAWRTLPYAFGRAGETAPNISLHLRGPEGQHWDFEQDHADVVVSGSAGEWCRLAARRLRAEDTGLQVEGPGATRVLELVRTYA